jgi:hypothetical protein
MIRSYNHKGFVLEVAIETSCRLLPPPRAVRYVASVTITRSGRLVTMFSPLRLDTSDLSSFITAEDALMCAHTAARALVDDWTRAAT